MMENKKILIIVGVGAAAIGLGYYFFVYKPNKDDKKGKWRATEEQFDKFVAVVTGVGGDMFQGITPIKLNEARGKFISKLTEGEASRLIAIAGKKEKEWSASEKIDFGLLIFKWMGKKSIG